MSVFTNARLCTNIAEREKLTIQQNANIRGYYKMNSKQYADDLLNKINQWQVQTGLADNATVLAAVMADLMTECGKIPKEQPKEQEKLVEQPPKRAPPKPKQRAPPPPMPTMPEPPVEVPPVAEQLNNLGEEEDYEPIADDDEELY